MPPTLSTVPLQRTNDYQEVRRVCGVSMGMLSSHFVVCHPENSLIVLGLIGALILVASYDRGGIYCPIFRRQNRVVSASR